jgi:ABC-type oligopeptide transport system ATPase subunit
MKNKMMHKYAKTVIMMRAVSGSGKTTISRCIISALTQAGLTIGIHSTDEFFMVGNRYVFEIEKLAEYHRKNLENFTADLQKGIDAVICDNMNLLPWQSESYTNAAREHGYRILFLNFLTRGLEKHLAAQQVTPEKPDAHNLSKELLIRLIDDFDTYNELLDKNNPIIPEKHFTYVWNDEKYERERTELPIRHFDTDIVVTIKPDEYRQMQQTVGQTVLSFIREDREVE